MLNRNKPFQTVDTKEAARLIADNLRAPHTLAFLVGEAETFIRTDEEGKVTGRRTPFIVNTPDSGWINVYLRVDGTLYVGQPKPTREAARASLERNAPNNNMTYVKTIEITV